MGDNAVRFVYTRTIKQKPVLKSVPRVNILAERYDKDFHQSSTPFNFERRHYLSELCDQDIDFDFGTITSLALGFSFRRFLYLSFKTQARPFVDVANG